MSGRTATGRFAWLAGRNPFGWPFDSATPFGFGIVVPVIGSSASLMSFGISVSFLGPLQSTAK
jgi:hypothetical protein